MRVCLLFFTFCLFHRSALSFQEISGEDIKEVSSEDKSNESPDQRTLCSQSCPKKLVDAAVQACSVGCDLYIAQLQWSDNPDITEYMCDKGCSSMTNKLNIESCSTGCQIMRKIMQKPQKNEANKDKDDEIDDGDVRTILQDDDKEKSRGEDKTDLDNKQQNKDIKEIIEDTRKGKVNNEEDNKEDHENNKEGKDTKKRKDNFIHDDKEPDESNEIPPMEVDFQENNSEISDFDSNKENQDGGDYHLYIVGNFNDVLQYMYQYRKYSLLRHLMLQQMQAGREVDNRQMDLLYHQPDHRPQAERITDKISENVKKYIKNAKDYFVNDFNVQFFQILLLGICIGVLCSLFYEMTCTKQKKKRTIPCTQDYYILEKTALPPPNLPTYEECVKKVVLLDTPEHPLEEKK